MTFRLKNSDGILTSKKRQKKRGKKVALREAINIFLLRVEL
jgi:hypothetical protein